MNKLRMFFLIMMVSILPIFVGIMVWIYSNRQDPILYSHKDESALTHGPTFIILNPFRDRKPEMAAENILRQIASGDCEKALFDVPIGELGKTHICSKEIEYKLVDWSLCDRKQNGSIITMRYRTRRNGSSGFPCDGTIEVQESPTKDWKVISVDFIY